MNKHSYLWIIKESQTELLIHVQVFLLSTSHCGDDDNTPLLALKFLHAAHLDVSVPSLFQHRLDFLHLQDKMIVNLSNL